METIRCLFVLYFGNHPAGDTRYAGEVHRIGVGAKAVRTNFVEVGAGTADVLPANGGSAKHSAGFPRVFRRGPPVHCVEMCAKVTRKGAVLMGLRIGSQLRGDFRVMSIRMTGSSVENYLMWNLRFNSVRARRSPMIMVPRNSRADAVSGRKARYGLCSSCAR